MTQPNLNLVGRQYSVLRLNTTINSPGYGNMGPNLYAGKAAKQGFDVSIYHVDGGVLVTFGKPGVPDFFIGAASITSGTFLPEGAKPEEKAMKATIVSKPNVPTAAPLPGNQLPQVPTKPN